MAAHRGQRPLSERADPRRPRPRPPRRRARGVDLARRSDRSASARRPARPSLRWPRPRRSRRPRCAHPRRAAAPRRARGGRDPRRHHRARGAAGRGGHRSRRRHVVPVRPSDAGCGGRASPDAHEPAPPRRCADRRHEREDRRRPPSDVEPRRERSTRRRCAQDRGRCRLPHPTGAGPTPHRTGPASRPHPAQCAPARRHPRRARPGRRGSPGPSRRLRPDPDRRRPAAGPAQPGEPDRLLRPAPGPRPRRPGRAQDRAARRAPVRDRLHGRPAHRVLRPSGRCPCARRGRARRLPGPGERAARRPVPASSRWRWSIARSRRSRRPNG